MSGKFTFQITIINDEIKLKEEVAAKEEALRLREEALAAKEESLRLREESLKPKTKVPKVLKPKGPIPPQLRKNCEWVSYTVRDALVNGWESFIVHSKKEGVPEIVMPASINHLGNHIFKDSITEDCPDGKMMTHKYAMSLSKQRKSLDHPTSIAFEAYYLNDESIGPGY